MDEDLLDSALEEFEDEKKETSAKKTDDLQEVLNEIKQEMNEDRKDDPDNFGEMEDMINSLVSEFENNPELKDQIDQLGKNFFQGGVLKESMEELRAKLKDYLNTHNDIPSADLSRYQSQLQIYDQICEKISSGEEDQAIELVSKLSYYGELPQELAPPLNEDCLII
jgi:superfamily I DNA/RNA helicase